MLLGSLGGLLGRIYGQVPALVPTLVALLAVLMGLNLLGLLHPLLGGPDPDRWRDTVPAPLAPVAPDWPSGWQLLPHHAGAGRVAGLDRPERQALVGMVLLSCWHRPGAAVAAGRHVRRQRAPTSGAAFNRSLGAPVSGVCCSPVAC